MSSSIATRWPVLVDVPLQAVDCDADGCLTEAAIQRIFAVARTDYFALCTTFDPTTARVAGHSIIRGEPVDTDIVSISVGVVEVYPDSFTMEARVRPAEGDGIAARAQCSVKIESGVTEAVRDELIALAHSARYFH